MTSAFVDFSKSRGNDLSTPQPKFGFPGLIPNPIDQNPCAQSRNPMDMIFQG